MVEAAAPIPVPAAAQSSAAQLLETLHPLREPPPPAAAWPYLLMLAAGIALAAAVAALLRLRRRRGLRASAAAALASSRTLSPPERFAAQAQLLRRLVRAAGGDALAQGAAWLEALDRTFATTAFTRGRGRVFADDLYRRGTPDDLDGIEQLLAGLIAEMRSPARPQPAASGAAIAQASAR